MTDTFPPNTLRACNASQVAAAALTIDLLRAARGHAQVADSPKTLARIKAALKSADGALRHANRRFNTFAGYTAKPDADLATCTACGRAEHVNLLDGKDGGDGNFTAFECIACYGPGWAPTDGPADFAKSVRPELAPIYAMWTSQRAAMDRAASAMVEARTAQRQLEGKLSRARRALRDIIRNQPDEAPLPLEFEHEPFGDRAEAYANGEDVGAWRAGQIAREGMGEPKLPERDVLVWTRIADEPDADGHWKPDDADVLTLADAATAMGVDPDVLSAALMGEAAVYDQGEWHAEPNGGAR